MRIKKRKEKGRETYSHKEFSENDLVKRCCTGLCCHLEYKIAEVGDMILGKVGPWKSIRMSC